MANNTNPTELLSPDAVPVLHSIMPGVKTLDADPESILPSPYSSLGNNSERRNDKRARRTNNNKNILDDSAASSKRIKTELKIEPHEPFQFINIEVDEEEDAEPRDFYLPEIDPLSLSPTNSNSSSINVPTPTDSSSSSQLQTDKRPKINETGFPSVRSKRKIDDDSTSGQSIKLIEGIEESDNESASSSSAVTIDDPSSSQQQSLVATTNNLIKMTISSSSSSFGGQLEGEMKSSTSLSEHLQMRKRGSVRGFFKDLIKHGELRIPGVCPNLVDVEDPPLFLPQKTNFISAGLLSNHFKGTKVVSRESQSPTEKIATTSSLPSLNTTTTSRILPPPAYSDIFIREKKRDFLLPYDIWCHGVIHSRNSLEQWREQRDVEQATAAAIEKSRNVRKLNFVGRSSSSSKQQKVPMPGIIPSVWNYKKIRNNVYFGRKPVSDADIDQMCYCQDNGDVKCAADDCLNRVVFVECPALCGENCKNRRIQKHENAGKVKKFMTPDKGWGVKTCKPIKEGEFIMEYVGEVVSNSVFEERMHTIYAKDTHHYCLHLDGGMVIDGHRVGGECRFVNHSCEPNCEMQKWSVNGLSRMALFALRDIEAEEELSYDYNFCLFNHAEAQPCYCKSTNCRGVIGGRSKIKNDGNGHSERKSSKSKGALGIVDMNSAVRDSAIKDKMKPLSRKDRLFIQSQNIFPVRNYEKIWLRRGGEGEFNINARLENMMKSWASRFKAGSSNNKPLTINDNNPKLIEMAKIAQIFHELFATVTTTEEGNHLLCEPFMQLPSKRKFPQLYSSFPKEQPPFDLSMVGKKILCGEYMTIQALETDIAVVLITFSQAYEKEYPKIMTTVRKIKNIYVQAKTKAIAALEPFIVTTIREEDLPKFIMSQDQEKSDHVIRCICGTFSDDVFMIQCDKCLVWQHGECVGVPNPDMNDQMEGYKGKKRQNNKNRKNNRKSYSSPSNSITQFCYARGAGGSSQDLGLPHKLTSPQQQGKEEMEIDGDVNNVQDKLLVMDEDDKLKVLEGHPMVVQKENPGPICLDIGEVVEFGNLSVVEGDASVAGSDTDSNNQLVTIGKDEGNNSIQSNDDDDDDSSKDNKMINLPNSNEPYHCEKCNPRYINPEVKITNNNNDRDKIHYLTLVRDDGFTIRLHDTIYILRNTPASPVLVVPGHEQDDDAKIRSRKSEKVKYPNKIAALVEPSTTTTTVVVGAAASLGDAKALHRNDQDGVSSRSNQEKQKKPRKQVSYKRAGPLVPTECDIFRVEGLWKEVDGSRWIFGNRFLRPNETFPEPNRKFYPNEILKSPRTECIPIDAIHGLCWVMDSGTFCKGRPFGSKEEHVYICEFRVDKKAQIFTPLPNSFLGICMQPFAFKYFVTRLKIQRYVHPYRPLRPNFKPKSVVSACGTVQEKGRPREADDKSKRRATSSVLYKQKLASQRIEKTNRINSALLNLMTMVPSFHEDASDLSYLLSKGRKKPTK